MPIAGPPFASSHADGGFSWLPVIGPVRDNAQRMIGRPNPPKAPVPSGSSSQQNVTPAGSPQPADPVSRRTIVCFVFLFGVFVGLFYLISATTMFREHVFPEYLHANAKAAAAILAVFGQGTTATGHSVTSNRFGVSVERGCDAVEPTVLFLAAVLASPVAFQPKIPGLVFGTLALAVVNLLRIITLFLTGIYWPAAFHVMHVDVWQAIFIFLALLFWVFWALWALKRNASKPHAAS